MHAIRNFLHERPHPLPQVFRTDPAIPLPLYNELTHLLPFAWGVMPLFSRAIMEARGGASRCTIATSSYHCLRTAMFAKRLGINAVCVGGRTAAFYYPAAFFREYIALIMRNIPAVAAFFALVTVRFALVKMGIVSDVSFF